jgi:PhnB protein
MLIPKNFGTVTPYFFVDEPKRFIDFLVQGLDGVLVLEHKLPNGRLANAQVQLGTTTVMISEASKPYPAMAAAYYLYVEDADSTMRKALQHGAKLEMEVANMSYGDRQGGVRDSHGNLWWISQRLVATPYT